jgi:hypothetical protein
MTAVEQVLRADMNELLDRLASSVPGGCLSGISATQPTLRKRLDEMEDHLTDARAAVLDGYGRWLRALEDIESLWALGAYRIDGMGPDMAPQTPRRSEHPGEAEALLGIAGRSLAAEEPVEPARAIAA